MSAAAGHQDQGAERKAQQQAQGGTDQTKQIDADEQSQQRQHLQAFGRTSCRL
ncbi:hypothetical protein [Synechococcus sp. A15-24]|uniref:hypothetical protein n=1 Tax=Synechococcus sp. A15-24 TaxID=1050635 RepID=UPI003369C8DE